MGRRRLTQGGNRSQGQEPWWRQYAAQLVVGLTVTAAGVLLTVMFTKPEQDTSRVQCNASSDLVTDYMGRQFNMRYYCSTYVGSAVYGNVLNSQASELLDDTGYMNQASSVWVICQWQGRPNPIIQDKANSWWLYTQADQSRPNTHGYTSAWGYLPATVVTEGRPNEPVPGVRACTEYY
jgi:hypothetical protein